MTKTDIAVKMRHYCTLLAASLFSFVCLCPSIGFSDTFVTSDGKISCSISNGSASCRPLSDDVDYDCMMRIQSLLSSSSRIDIYLSYANFVNGLNGNDAVAGRSALANISPDPSEDYDYQVAKHAFDNIVYDCQAVSNRIEQANSVNLSTRDILSTFSCSSCDESSMTCCCCSNSVYFSEFSFQLTNLVNVSVSLSNSVDDISRYLESVTNYLSSISSTLGSSLHSGTLGQYYYRLNKSKDGFFSVRNDSLLKPHSSDTHNILDMLNILDSNIMNAQSSINNYLYVFYKQQLPSISNDIHALSVDFSDYFSFFRDEVSVRPVLEDWTPSDGGYYNFLTNYYLRVVNRDSSLSSTSKTNWFSRIETLLASLVFSDSVESTNTVNVSSASSEASTLLQTTLDGVSSMGSTGSSQLSAFRDTSQNLVSSLRSISASFSRAADPGTVHLVNLSSSSGSRSSSDSISFETSDIRNLVEACHCVTTLCWCFGGLLLLYYFLHWTVRTSYGLLVFAWGVVSAIFRQ